jgi:hypothetical protein
LMNVGPDRAQFFLITIPVNWHISKSFKILQA